MDVRSGGAELEGRTGADGWFVVAGLGADPYVLEVEPPPGHLAPPAAKVRGGDRVVAIRVERGVRPTVRVVDAKGEPVRGALVEVETISSPFSTSGVVTHEVRLDGTEEERRTTSRDGSFRLPALAPRIPVRLVVTPPANRAELAQFREGAWTPADVTITLPAGFVVRGRVEDLTLTFTDFKLVVVQKE